MYSAMIAREALWLVVPVIVDALVHCEINM